MIKESKEVLEEVYERYNKDPLGWFISLGVDRRNRSVILVQKSNKVWQIKTHHITPYNRISLGGKAKARGDESPSMMSFGWRDLSSELFQKIQRDMKSNGEVSIEVIEEISKIDPKPLEDDFDSIMEGPFNVLSNPMASISKGQEKLDKKLSVELDKLMLKRDGGGMYV
ncbi:MAG: hypothetical protein JW825_05185 [Candidatus Methanofastidiosa archaeon]|nr:hypothetical protein [Candidatus Methanofastidiosa archaeon]